MQRTHAEKK